MYVFVVLTRLQKFSNFKYILAHTQPQEVPKIIFWLVVGPPLWKILVNWDDEIPNIWENKKCSKPPTSLSGQCVPLVLKAWLLEIQKLMVDSPTGVHDEVKSKKIAWKSMPKPQLKQAHFFEKPCLYI